MVDVEELRRGRWFASGGGGGSGPPHSLRYIMACARVHTTPDRVRVLTVDVGDRRQVFVNSDLLYAMKVLSRILRDLHGVGVSHTHIDSDHVLLQKNSGKVCVWLLYDRNRLNEYGHPFNFIRHGRGDDDDGDGCISLRLTEDAIFALRKDIGDFGRVLHSTVECVDESTTTTTTASVTRGDVVSKSFLRSYMNIVDLCRTSQNSPVVGTTTRLLDMRIVFREIQGLVTTTPRVDFDGLGL